MSLSMTFKILGQNNVSILDETITDPIKLEFKTSGTRATIGARLNLAFFKDFCRLHITRIQYCNRWSCI